MKFFILSTVLVFSNGLYANQYAGLPAELGEVTGYQAVPELLAKSLVDKRFKVINKRNIGRYGKLSGQRLNMLLSDIKINALKKCIGYFTGSFSQNSVFQKKAMAVSLKRFSVEELNYIVNTTKTLKSHNYPSRKNANLLMSDPIHYKYHSSRKEIALAVIENNKNFINNLYPGASSLVDKTLAESFKSLFNVKLNEKHEHEHHYKNKPKKFEKEKSKERSSKKEYKERHSGKEEKDRRSKKEGKERSS